MKLNQIVYVVIDHEEEKVIGAFNDYTTAKRVAYDMNKLTYDGSEISITPVLVDTVNWVTNSRQYYLTEQEVLDATQEEIELAMPEDEDEDEDDEDCDYDEDEDEDDEYDPTDYTYEGDEDEKSAILSAVDEAIERIKASLDDLMSELRCD